MMEFPTKSHGGLVTLSSALSMPFVPEWMKH